MGHVVDKVVFHFGQLFLPENNLYRIEKTEQNNGRKYDRQQQSLPDRAQDEARAVRKIDRQVPRRFDVLPEQVPEKCL